MNADIGNSLIRTSERDIARFRRSSIETTATPISGSMGPLRLGLTREIGLDPCVSTEENVNVTCVFREREDMTRHRRIGSIRDHIRFRCEQCGDPSGPTN